MCKRVIGFLLLAIFAFVYEGDQRPPFDLRKPCHLGDAYYDASTGTIYVCAKRFFR